MNTDISLAMITEELESLDPFFRGNDTHLHYRTGVVLLSAAYVTGADQEELVEFTGYQRDLIRTIAIRMHNAGLWEESGFVHSDHWFQGGNYCVPAVWADITVALGEMIARPGPDGQFQYRAAEGL